MERTCGELGRGTQADELILDVRLPSNPHLHQKGRTGVPRAQVSVVVDLYLRHHRAKTGERRLALVLAW